MNALSVSFIFIALCAASLIGFGAWIGLLRGKLGVLRGDGGDAVLFKRIRIHANFIENAPLYALVMVAAEAVGAPAGWLWLAVGVFFVGRLIHYLRFDHNDRAFGILLNTGPAAALGVFVILKTLNVL